MQIQARFVKHSPTVDDSKVHIFWEGHNILRNLYRRFVLYSASQIYSGDFAKFFGLLKIPIWTLNKLIWSEIKNLNSLRTEKICCIPFFGITYHLKSLVLIEGAQWLIFCDIVQKIECLFCPPNPWNMIWFE